MPEKTLETGELTSSFQKPYGFSGASNTSQIDPYTLDIDR